MGTGIDASGPHCGDRQVMHARTAPRVPAGRGVRFVVRPCFLENSVGRFKSFIWVDPTKFRTDDWVSFPIGYRF